MADETREEMFLRATAGETVNLPTPITRKEFYLAKAAGLKVNTPEPITREEMYLKAIAESGGGGGGEGGSIVIANPTLVGTEADLTGLEVDGIKYAVPGGGGDTNLYEHNILFSGATQASFLYISTKLLSTSATPLDWGGFVTEVRTRGFTNRYNQLPVSGHYTSGGSSYKDIISIYFISSYYSGLYGAVCQSNLAGQLPDENIGAGGGSPNFFYDTVVQIL